MGAMTRAICPASPTLLNELPLALSWLCFAAHHSIGICYKFPHMIAAYGFH